jgi:integrase
MFEGVWEWTDKAPKLKTYTEQKQRIRWITEEEAQRLLAELPSWLQPMARFALATGLRQSNVLRLEWSQVDLERRVAWVHPDQAKARRAIGVPLNDEAVGVIRGQLGKHLTRVFTGPESEPMDRWTAAARSGWEKGCRKAGIKDFRWHDLRHTFASWHVQRGTPLYALKELGGWQTLEMVNRYAHLAPQHLKAYAENSATSQSRHTRTEPEVAKVA